MDYKYDELSIELTKKISKDVKKNNGIYFTPPNTVFNIINYIKNHNIKSILEPSCGSCEFIKKISLELPLADITGIEYNKEIFDSIQKYNNNKIKLYNINFLEYNDNIKYDLIIGNPPYYVMNKKDIDKKYYKYFDGRPNIFILFIIKSLSYLNKEGILSFILPKNFLNCLYYEKTRRYIIDNFHILYIIECNDKYIETQQETIVIIIQNKIGDNNKFIIEINKNIIFGTIENIEKLKKLYDNSTSLYNLGFNVSVGNIVWNQCKNILTDDNSKTRLIYNSDIIDNKLILKEYNNKDKKNYINKDGINKPLLVINRGYGVGNYNFNYCLINVEYEYLIENHLICINYNEKIKNNELIDIYNKIITSLEDERTKEFIKLYFGNNAINTTELNYIIPIYIT